MSASETHPRVLLVEDDALVAAVAVDTLQEFGFEVVEAGTAKAALAVATSAMASICAAVIDVGLPDSRGDELALAFRRLRADLPIIVATGYGEAELANELRAQPMIAVLNKPYDTELLRAAFQAVGLMR